MATKRFIPKNAGMTKANIVNFVNDHIDIYIDVETPYTAKDFSDAVCQKFANEEYDLREDCVDMAEEDFVDARDSLTEALIAKLKGGRLVVAAIKDERGY